MRTTFERLFSVGITHGFYGGPSRDFVFAIPADTSRVLAGHRLVARTVNDELVVAYELNESETGPLVDATGRKVRIALRLVNPDFANFTELLGTSAGSVRLYHNDAAPSALGGPFNTTWAPSTLSHVLRGSTRPVTVAAVRDGITVRADVISDMRAAATLDLRGVDPGRLEVREIFSGSATHSTAYYLDPDALRDNAFAIVEIVVGHTFYGAAPAFRIAFDAKEETLKYYVVVVNYTAPDVAALTMQDAGFTDDSRPKITFSRTAASSFAADDLPPATLAEPGATVVLFKSQTPVRRQAKARRRLQLMKSTDVLIENMPQAGAAKPTADLVVHLSKPKRI